MQVARPVLLGLLETFAQRGVAHVRAAALARESRAIGHYVPKKFVRRWLSVDGDGVTGVPGVTIIEEPTGRFWFALA
jgi:hypothetical protein